MPKKKNEVGRPSDYTEELAERFCAELAQGQSMVAVCKSEEYPHRATIFRWIGKYPEFRDKYEKAKEECADYLVEEMLDIADNGSNDWMERNGEDNEGYQLNGEHVQRSRLRLDTRKWIASKLKRKKYGDSSTTTHEGNIRLTDLSEDELDRKILQLEQAHEQSTKD